MNYILKRWKKLNPSKKIALSFLSVIILGSILLYLPISQNGQAVSFIDCLFIAVSATCVTGLSTIPIASHFNFFGQLVILLLIQIGGLGLMTILASFLLVIKNKISLSERIALKNMLNKEGFFDFYAFILDVLKFTLLIELIGAILLSPFFIQEFGLLRGLTNSIFIAISAFCNAGFDNFGASSLEIFHNNLAVNIIIALLIILGGIGFGVFRDLSSYTSARLKKDQNCKNSYLIRIHISFHSQLVILISLILIVLGTIIILVLENDGIISSLFHSISLRTAGFSSLDFSQIKNSTKLFMMLMMFIGGSPGGTAGGVKTTTFFVVLLYIITMISAKEKVVVRKREIPFSLIHKSLVIILFNLTVLILGTFLLTISENLNFIDLLFEATSALATVGLSTGVTTNLSIIGKIIIIALMYIGRIGILTILLSFFNLNSSRQEITYPSANIMVG